MGAGIIMLVIGLAAMIGPWFIPTPIPMIARLVLMIFGAVFSIIGGILIVITSLYVKTTSNTAFVRNGMGGEKIVIGGGCLVFPVVHTKTDVSLGTIKMEVERIGPLALITGDKLRGDVKAEFFIKVDKLPEDVGNNARTLGVRATDPDYITALMEPKLISALRSVAAKSPLEQLNSNREDFAVAVGQAVKADLKENGYTLESVTVSSLDQTSLEHFREDNIFDAEGKRHAVEVTSTQRVAANIASRNAEQAIAEQDTTTRTVVADQEFKQKQADAIRDANVRKTQAEQDKEAQVYAADQDRLTREAQITATQKVGQAEAEKDKQIRLAQVAADQAAATAGVLKEQAIEVAGREKEIAIAEAEQKRATAEALQLQAEQEKERENQGVITVTKQSEAERDKVVQVIAAEKEAAVTRTSENIKADIERYKNVTIAEGEQQAAEKKAQAIKIAAEADKSAKVLQATGEQAVQMVPVNVAAEQVAVDAKRQTEVEQARVNVLQQELKAKADHEIVSVELEKAKLTISALRDVGVEEAKAMGFALSQSNLNIFGDTTTVERIGQMFRDGQGVGALVKGLTGGKFGIDDLIEVGGAALAKVAASKLLPKTKEEGEVVEQKDKTEPKPKAEDAK